jgi:O-antigen/teichoic acid export membrane protein
LGEGRGEEAQRDPNPLPKGRRNKTNILSENAQNLWGGVSEPKVGINRQTAPAGTGAREFALDTAVVAAAQFLLKFRGLIAIPLIVKVLGTAQYGVWVQTLALVDIAGSLVGLNLYHPLVRFLAGKSHEGRSIYSTLWIATAATSLVGGMLMYLLAPRLSQLILGSPEYLWHIRAGALLMLCYNLRLLNLNAYRAIGRLKQRSIVELCSTFGQLAGITVLLWRGHGLLDVLIFMGIWETVFVLVLSSNISRIVGWGRFKPEILTQALKYALPLLPAGLSIFLLDRGDRLVLGSYLGPKVVGIYSANYALASLLMLFQTPLQMTLFPKVSALWDSDRAGAVRYISVSNKLFLSFAIPFVVGMPILAGGLLSRIGNPEIGAAGGQLTFLVAAGVMLWGISVMQSQIFYGARRTIVVGVVTVGGAVLNLLLNLALVPRWGINAAAFSTLTCYLLTCVGLYLLSRPIAHLTFYWTHLLKCVAASLLMAAIIRAMDTLFPNAVVIPVILAGLVYFVALWLLRALAPTELEFIKGLFRSPAAIRD